MHGNVLSSASQRYNMLMIAAGHDSAIMAYLLKNLVAGEESIARAVWAATEIALDSCGQELATQLLFYALS